MYLNQLEEVVRYSLPKGNSVAGFFAESIQGGGGTVQYPRGYIKRAFERVRQLGGVCISDEVQTGFGRTGEHYWGFQVNMNQLDKILVTILSFLRVMMLYLT